MQLVTNDMCLTVKDTSFVEAPHYANAPKTLTRFERVFNTINAPFKAINGGWKRVQNGLMLKAFNSVQTRYL